ncbi:MAG: glycosyltransferase [Candidatus Eiseniibacteriota bacterium]|nr:MAG: glycosyltransferase [Candidatus Eisenbacteria bacterium]
MTRILLVKPVMPYPPDQGTKVVTLSLLEMLSRHFEVSLVCGLLDRRDASKVQKLRPFCKQVYTYLLPNRRSVFHSAYYKGLNTLRAWLSGFPAESFYLAPDELSRTVAEATRSSSYDIVQFDYWYTADAARFAEVPYKVLLEHDVDFLRYQRRLTIADGFWERRSIERTLSAVRSREIRAYSEFDRVLALSDADRVLIEKLAGIRGISRHLPVAVDCEKFTPASQGKIPSSIVFLGALDADFNVDAISFFCRSVFPLVLAGVSDARLFIVGRRPPRSVQKLADGRRIVVSSDVDDVAPYVKRCMVQVVPLRFGGGVRIRTLEGMAMGMAIVSTTIGMDGIAAKPGRDLLLGDTPQEFAARVIELLRSPVLGRRLGGRAREFAVQHHGREVVEKQVFSLYEELKKQREEKQAYMEKRTGEQE